MDLCLGTESGDEMINGCSWPQRDDDGDGWSNEAESDCQTSSNDFEDYPLDTDGDKLCDLVDSDDDGDGTVDSLDQLPLDPQRRVISIVMESGIMPMETMITTGGPTMMRFRATLTT